MMTVFPPAGRRMRRTPPVEIRQPPEANILSGGLPQEMRRWQNN
jgi:hypothetical protein